MDFDEDQQALAWQQIIRNKAFDNVRVQRGESWVDAACRTLDELVDQKESLDKECAKLMSDYQDVEDERDEWKSRADRWYGAWRKNAPARTVTREDVEKAISELRTFPRFLTDELLVLRDEAIDAVWALVSGDDSVEQKAVELFEATDESIWAWATAPVQTQDMYRRIAEHILWQEDQ